MKGIKFVLILLILSAFILSCGNSEHKSGDSKPVIAVSILPQKYFLERIGGGRVSVLVLAGEGQNPHSYEPTPNQMASLAKAGAWILSGVDFEIILKQKIAEGFPSVKIVDGTKGVRFRMLEVHSHEGEKKDKAEAHGNNIDRHTWLGREPAKIMSGHILDTLIKTDPAGESFYQSNYQNLIKEIDTLFDSLKKDLSSFSGEKVFVFHPAFGYFLDEFGMEQEAVETGGKEPSAKALAALIDKAKKEKPMVIFVQAQFPVSAAGTIADSVGAGVVMLDPLSPDWPGNIKRMGAALQNSLKKK